MNLYIVQSEGRQHFVRADSEFEAVMNTLGYPETEGLEVQVILIRENVEETLFISRDTTLFHIAWERQ